MSFITIPFIPPSQKAAVKPRGCWKLTPLVRAIRDSADFGDYGEIMALGLIRAEARRRQFDRDRPGWANFDRIIANLDYLLDGALSSVWLDREDLARFGYPTQRLSSFDPDGSQRAIYESLPKGRYYRLNGRIVRKEAA